jgi:hypothetical protein
MKLTQCRNFRVNLLTLLAGQQGKIVNNYGTLFLTLALIVGDSIGIFSFYSLTTY